MCVVSFFVVVVLYYAIVWILLFSRVPALCFKKKRIPKIKVLIPHSTPVVCRRSIHNLRRERRFRRQKEGERKRKKESASVRARAKGKRERERERKKERKKE